MDWSSNDLWSFFFWPASVWSVACWAGRSSRCCIEWRTPPTRSGTGGPSGQGPPSVVFLCWVSSSWAVPEMYGVGYPVMERAIGGHYVLWFLLGPPGREDCGDQFDAFDRRIGRCVRSVAVHRRDGGHGLRVVGPACLRTNGRLTGGLRGSSHGRGLRCRGQAPLTATASALEMTGNFSLVLPALLVVGIASALSKHLSDGNIYTTRLLRRGVDIEHLRAGWVA